MLFNSVLTDTAGTLTITNALLCTGVSLVLGLVIALVSRVGTVQSKNFTISLVILPVLVQAVIMMVNGNLGTGIAVLGAFSLIRFRSVPGSAREICTVFFAMGVGLATGTGYLTFAAAMTAAVSAVLLLLTLTRFCDREHPSKERHLRVSIPENLDYTDLFDDLFTQYTGHHRLTKVKTTNMGSLFELTYDLTLSDPKQEKEFLDAIRCRNGNLPVVCGIAAVDREIL